MPLYEPIKLCEHFRRIVFPKQANNTINARTASEGGQFGLG